MFSRKMSPHILIVLLATIYAPTIIAQRVERPTSTYTKSQSVRSYSPDINAIDLHEIITTDPRGLALKKVSYRLSNINSSESSMHFSVLSRNSNSISVRPATRIRYEVVGILSDDYNQGLALIGFDLVFDGGDLEQAFSPTGEPTPGCDNPMINFTRPWGLTNPAGFGGTIIDGDLVQVGGGQNTINNTPDNADYPIGPVLTGVAMPSVCGPAVIVTGELQVPDVEGVYTLYITEFFGNVIKYETDGDPFWATEAFQVGTLTPLTITVSFSDDTDTTTSKPIRTTTRD